MKITPVFGNQSLFDNCDDSIVALRFVSVNHNLIGVTANELKNDLFQLIRKPIIALRLIEEDEPPVFKPESMSTVLVQNKKYTFYGYTDLGAVVLKNEITQEIVYADPDLVQPNTIKSNNIKLARDLSDLLVNLLNIGDQSLEFQEAIRKLKSDIAELLK